MSIPLWESVDDDDDESAEEFSDYSNFETDAEDAPEDLTEVLPDYGYEGSEPEALPVSEETTSEDVVSKAVVSSEEIVATDTEIVATSSERVSSESTVAANSQQLWSDDSSADIVNTEYVSKEVQITKKTSTIEYPFLYMNLGSQCAVEVNLIKAMLRQGVQDSEDPYYHVYLNIGGQVVQPEGVICCRELKTLLTTSIFKDVEKHIKLDADTTLKDEMMFALCMVDVF